MRTIAKLFQKAAGGANDNFTPKSLCDVFNEFAAESMRDFPPIDGKLVVYNGATSTWHGRIDNPERYPELVPDKGKIVSHARWGVSGTLAPTPSDAALIGIPERNTKDIRRLYMTLDHELAHCVIKEAGVETDDLVKKNLRECIADAYAMIRHYQRFGSRSNYVDPVTHPISRAYECIFIGGGSGDHYTSPVLEEVMRMRAQGFDFKSLSPSETAELALVLAKKHQPSSKLLYALQEMNIGFPGVSNVIKKALQDPRAKEKQNYQLLLNYNKAYAFLQKKRPVGASSKPSP